MENEVKCPLSYNADKSCYFAFKQDDEVLCSHVLDWYHDLNIKHHQHCFVKLFARQKLAWRNRMIKKFGPSKI
tara:strand:+ start:205 stop:423 length:219 start_codon:yes stop_codon:yes gene_type:complete